MTIALKTRLSCLLLTMLLSLAPLAASQALAQDLSPIDINAADAALLAELPGIGPSKASAIVEDREANGPYESAEDLTRVSGIGEVTVDGLADQITL
ncbi:ComEA family DNA-binding protein [Halomonas urmiana]|uniref:ComEA family DNA-binding protein n=1 Tax=Halomonas urmiana TaxID=490901 RepID=A0A5R8MDU2_9GAMM|nr:helix-hairpin-helix domain-containing protein [Halomonas urmiana]TLF47873.1 ComEA family DNA-binding protein [Halomonas urmiana]